MSRKFNVHVLTLDQNNSAGSIQSKLTLCSLNNENHKTYQINVIPFTSKIMKIW